MATLVFSTIGTALGGPVGSAIGALLGQSIDQQLLAPVRRGPRVGDLNVQTSSYGTQMPRVYGTMRIAGSVIWSTDLTEQTNSGGAKGQPDVSYSYTVSMAVAVSSRRAMSIKRIWADGKLLRGAAGDFKVGTKFRFYSGDEDQVVDPLIASSEGISLTPAYRGLAMCVFEDLELAEFGNRIPFLTFEVEADDEPVSVAEQLHDASRGLIAADDQRLLQGYAAYGRSIGDALQPIVESFGVDLFDDGDAVRSPTASSSLDIVFDDLGNSAEDKIVGRYHREQIPTRALPASLCLTYYDPSRDYQTGEARSSAGEAGVESQHDVPAVFAADEAKALANEVLARVWAGRDRLTLRLPPASMGCEPGTILTLPFAPARWQVESVTIEAFVAIVELRPATIALPALAADGGRIVDNPDAVSGPIALALLDIPDPGTVAGEPVLLLAASSRGEGWKARPAELQIGERHEVTQTARQKSVLGHALRVLADGTPYLLDELHSIEIELIDPEQWLMSCDEDALAAGANAAVLGNELIQFGRAEALGAGRFRLSRLLRGRAGTEWACGAHVDGETFCLLQPASLQKVTLGSANIGAEIEAVVGDATIDVAFKGEALRPLTPVNLSSMRQAGGDVLLRWTRRSRGGLAWIDGVDAPLGEAREQYRVVATSSARSIELSATEPRMLIEAATIAALGPGPISVSIQQVGDYAISRPTQIILD